MGDPSEVRRPLRPAEPPGSLLKGAWHPKASPTPQFIPPTLGVSRDDEDGFGHSFGDREDMLLRELKLLTSFRRCHPDGDRLSVFPPTTPNTKLITIFYVPNGVILLLMMFDI